MRKTVDVSVNYNISVTLPNAKGQAECMGKAGPKGQDAKCKMNMAPKCMDQFGGKPTMVQVNVLIPSGAPGYSGAAKEVGYECKPKHEKEKKGEPAGHHPGKGEPGKVHS
jgi:hypothetical protein